MFDVTRILNAIEEGDALAAEQLLPLVYEELRRLAGVQLAQERPGQTLDATSLVHEAYLRLVGDRQFASRRHFFTAAAEAMRRILVDSARRKQRLKRGGDRRRAAIDPAEIAAAETPDELLAVDEALGGLAEHDAQAAELVKLRYFVGMTVADAAEILNLSTRSTERLWTYARAWLRRSIEGL